MNITSFMNNNSSLNVKRIDISKPNYRIYLICDESLEIIYIGKTATLYGRLKAHYTRAEFNNMPVYYFDCSEKDVHELEMSLIRKYKPEYNVQISNSVYGYVVNKDYQRSLKSPTVRIKATLKKKIQLRYKYSSRLAQEMQISRQLLFGWLKTRTMPMKALSDVCEKIGEDPRDVIHKNSLQILGSFNKRKEIDDLGILY